MTLTPHTPGSAALMERFHASGNHDRLRPFLTPDPAAAPRFRVHGDPSRSVDFPTFLDHLAAILDRDDAERRAYTDAMEEWEARRSALLQQEDDARHDTRVKHPTAMEWREFERTEPRRPRGLPAPLQRLDEYDRGPLYDLLDRPRATVKPRDLEALDSFDVAASMTPGCPNVIDGAPCGEPLPGIVRSGRFLPTFGPKDWDTAAPWPGFGFCSNACRTAFGHERRQAFATLRTFAVDEAAALARRLVEVERERDSLRYELEFLRRAIEPTPDTEPATAEEAPAS